MYDIGQMLFVFGKSFRVRPLPTLKYQIYCVNMSSKPICLCDIGHNLNYILS